MIAASSYIRIFCVYIRFVITTNCADVVACMFFVTAAVSAAVVALNIAKHCSIFVREGYL